VENRAFQDAGIKVSEIVLWHRDSQWPAEKIAEQLELTMAEVYAALSYYFDHQREIDRQIEEGKKPSRIQCAQTD